MLDKENELSSIEKGEDSNINIEINMADEPEMTFSTDDIWRHVEKHNDPDNLRVKKNRIIKLSVIAVLLLIVSFFAFTPLGHKAVVTAAVKFFYKNVNVETPTPTPDVNVVAALTNTPTAIPTEAVPTEAPKPTQVVSLPKLTPTPTPLVESDAPIFDENVINILFVGIENLDENGKRVEDKGTADAITLISINKNTHSIKQVSFLKDMWLEIPGNEDGKLCDTYTYDGMQGVISTIESNFKVMIDGYVYLTFEDFVGIIDQLGGIRLNVSDVEAKYLNSTNYISKKSQRNVKAGDTKLTGAQVLGYCRITDVVSKSGTSADFGRAYRQKAVIKAVFDKYSKLDLRSTIVVTKSCLSKLHTNLTEEDIVNHITYIIDNSVSMDESMKIPVSGSYQYATVGKEKIISANAIENKKQLIEFLYGDKKANEQ